MLDIGVSRFGNILFEVSSENLFQNVQILTEIKYINLNTFTGNGLCFTSIMHMKECFCNISSLAHKVLIPIVRLDAFVSVRCVVFFYLDRKLWLLQCHNYDHAHVRYLPSTLPYGNERSTHVNLWSPQCGSSPSMGILKVGHPAQQYFSKC